MLTLAHFTPLVGQAFALRDEAGTAYPASLVEARPAQGPAGAAREPFSLQFQGPAEPVLPQCIYRVEHAQQPACEMFLVPVGRTPEGVRYEAVFN